MNLRKCNHPLTPRICQSCFKTFHWCKYDSLKQYCNNCEQKVIYTTKTKNNQRDNLMRCACGDYMVMTETVKKKNKKKNKTLGRYRCPSCKNSKVL